MDWAIGTGKTANLVRYAVTSTKKIIYVTPSYAEFQRFLEEYRSYGCRKKVVVLKGKSRLCIRENSPLSCYDCPYRKVAKVQPADNVYHEGLYSKACPYYNLLRQCMDADIILTHLYVLYELYRNNILPYNPKEAVLMLDEGEAVLRMLFPKDLKIIELEETMWKWLNLGSVDLLALIKLALQPLVCPNLPETVRTVFNYLISSFNPNNYVGRGIPVREALEENLPNIEAELKKLSFTLDPIEFEIALNSARLREEDKRLLTDLVWSLFALRELKVVKSKWKLNVDEVWITTFPVPLTKIGIIMKHDEVFLSSGSLSDRELQVLKLLKDFTIIKLKPSGLKHDNLLVLVCEKYNSHYLAYHLSRGGFLTYIIHSSYREAEEFSKTLLKTDVATPKTMGELENALKKGIRIMNLVQGSPLSMNLRLRGDVAIVNTYISKHVGLYDYPEELKKHCILAETYQALGRIINGEGRPVVLVMPTEVYEVLKEKFAMVEATAKKVNNDDEILEEIGKWIREPVGLKATESKLSIEKEVKPKRVRFRAEGRTYEYARIVIYLPSRYAGKRFRIHVEEVL